MVRDSCRLYFRSSQGFTLLELLTVMMLVSIMAAIAGPVLLGLFNRAQVEKEFWKLKAMLQLTQRHAMKKSQSCTMLLPINDIEAGMLTSSCAVLGSRTLEKVKVIYNRASSKKVTFNFRGHTSTLRTIVIYSNFTEFKRCMVISNGIGMMRSGIYTGSDLSSISAQYCQTTLY